MDRSFIDIRRSENRRDLDRKTWAAIDRAGFDVRVIGYGEYLTNEPVMFGRAFDAPPFFTFSVVGDVAAVGTEVKAIGWQDGVPSSEAPVGNWTGLRSQLEREGWLPDGSFEHQNAVWGDPYIPSISEVEPSYSVIDSGQGWQKIGMDNIGNTHQAGISNWWIQIGPPANTIPRWECSDEQAYPGEPGYQGSWSAKYEFDADPVSPWLVPVAVMSFNPYDFADEWTDEEIETVVYSMTNDAHGDSTTWPSGGLMDIALNPPLRKTTLVLNVYSDGPCEVEIFRRDWGDWFGEAPTFVGELSTENILIPVPAAAWTEARYVSLIDSRLWPNYPEADEPDGGPFDIGSSEYFFRLFKIRVNGGVPGQKVYIDNCWLWPDLTTLGMPLLTVGVAEWVRDEKGMYVGAHLWFKTGTETNQGAG